jgi:diphosphomevalonate decarboxylase
LREERRQLEEQDASVMPRGLWQWPLHIASVNNFPTAAGLASSASGFACLTFTLAHVYGLISTEDVHAKDTLTTLSKIARQGSGSACRSLFGGFVKWSMGNDSALGSDSVAVQVAPRQHWPEMSAMILVTNAHKKAVSSTEGMQTTVATSALFQTRMKEVVPERMFQMEEAILHRDFDAFADLTMKDSNQFHAVCLDSFPPIFYLNDTSRQLIHFVHHFNACLHEVTGRRYHLAYTFDAGPNAVFYYLAPDLPLLVAALQLFFEQGDRWSELKSPALNAEQGQLWSTLAAYFQEHQLLGRLDTTNVQRIIYTHVGDGPQLLTSGPSLLDALTGMPKQKSE